MPNRVFILSFLLAFVFFLASFASAQDPQSDSSSQSGSASPQPQDKETDPLKRPLTEKQRKENEKRFKQEVSSSFKKWLNEDVAYIITDEERAAFKQLSNDEERDNFIEAFWQRSSKKNTTAASPTPTSTSPPASPAGKATAAESI